MNFRTLGISHHSFCILLLLPDRLSFLLLYNREAADTCRGRRERRKAGRERKGRLCPTGPTSPCPHELTAQPRLSAEAAWQPHAVWAQGPSAVGGPAVHPHSTAHQLCTPPLCAPMFPPLKWRHLSTSLQVCRKDPLDQRCENTNVRGPLLTTIWQMQSLVLLTQSSSMAPGNLDFIDK